MDEMGSGDHEYAFKKLGAELSNWGRWGTDDQVGTVNLITAAARAAAAALVRTGEVIDLGMSFGTSGPQSGGLRFNPVHTMSMLPTDPPRYADGLIVADDVVTMPLQCATQWDGLAHVGYDGLLYNGVPASAVTALQGATRNAMDLVVPRLIGRGVLLDIAHLKGVSSLPAGEEITADDLDSAHRQQGVEVRSGDILLVRTGWHQTFLAGDHPGYLGSPAPGLGLSCAQWLRHHDVAAVCADNMAVECRPAREEGTSLPLHMVLIRDMGMTLGEMFDLEALAENCLADGTWEFLFSGIGIKFTGSVGTPVTPIAVK